MVAWQAQAKLNKQWGNKPPKKTDQKRQAKSTTHKNKQSRKSKQCNSKSSKASRQANRQTGKQADRQTGKERGFFSWGGTRKDAAFVTAFHCVPFISTSGTHTHRHVCVVCVCSETDVVTPAIWRQVILARVLKMESCVWRTRTP